MVVTGTPRRRSRRGSDTPSPVAAAAAELGLRVTFDPADLAGCGADCAVVVAYGRLIGADLLARTPMLNLHFSLLPRWRGAAPVERALLAGDETTGVCLMALEPTLDTGPVYWQHEVPIGPADTAASLRDRLATEGAYRLTESLGAGLGTPVPQSGAPAYARKLTSADRQIDWSQPTAVIDRQIRTGGAWTTLYGQRFLIRQAAPVRLDTSRIPTASSPSPSAAPNAAPGTQQPPPSTPAALRPPQPTPPGTLVDDSVVTGDGLLRLQSVQPAGRSATNAQAWLRGARLQPGTRFDTPQA